MRRLATVTIAAAAAISILPASPALANHCNGEVLDLGGVAYVDNRGLDHGDVWVYVESNDNPGLQSGGSAPDGGYADSCAHESPDTLIY